MLATVVPGAIACSPPGQRRQAQRALQQAAPFRPLHCCRPRPSSHRQHVSCAARREEAASSSQQQQGSQAAPAAAADAEAEPLGLQHAEQQREEQQQHAAGAGTRWMPASMLSGWKGAGSMLLSLGAVSGSGLLGELAAVQRLAAVQSSMFSCLHWPTCSGGLPPMQGCARPSSGCRVWIRHQRTLLNTGGGGGAGPDRCAGSAAGLPASLPHVGLRPLFHSPSAIAQAHLTTRGSRIGSTERFSLHRHCLASHCAAPNHASCLRLP